MPPAAPPEDLQLFHLQRMSVEQLEELYAHPQEIAVPAGRFKGAHLQRLPAARARGPLWPLVEGLFKYPPYYVDFDRADWVFFSRPLAVGRFEACVEASRWRETQAVCLHYGRSRLPGLIRRLFYDEVKPLSPDLCLGLGGLNDDRGRGDLFFFALYR